MKPEILLKGAALKKQIDELRGLHESLTVTPKTGYPRNPRIVNDNTRDENDSFIECPNLSGKNDDIENAGLSEFVDECISDCQDRILRMVEKKISELEKEFEKL